MAIGISNVRLMNNNKVFKGIVYKCILLLTVLLTSEAKAQFSLGVNGIDGIVGYQYQKYNTVELGIAYGTRGTDAESLFYRNIHLCSEILLNDKGSNIYGLKAGLTYTYILVNAAAQFTYYSNFNQSSFVFRPEIGLTYIGLVDINIGQNLVLASNDPMGLNATVFILRYTLGSSSRGM